MSDKQDNCQENICNDRRNFLISATATAGGVLLTLAGARSASAATESTKPVADDSVVIKLDDKSPLSKVGGSDTVDTKDGKVIVVRTGDATFAAYSAICTHKGGPIKYDTDKKQLMCPWHNSRFDMTGNPVGGPAKAPLTSFNADESMTVTITRKA